MFCPQCKAEYRVGFVRCSDCDVELVDHLQPNPPRVFQPDAKLVVVCSFLSGFDAGLARGVLKSAGIDAEIRGYEMGKLASHIGMTAGVDLLVREEDAAAADEILNTDATPLSGTDA